MQETLDIHYNYFILGNNPELAKIFSNSVAKEFLSRLLKDVNPKEIKNGYESYFADVIKQLSNSFVVVEYCDITTGEMLIKAVELDDKVKVNDGRVLPITRMYEDESGLHIRQRN